MATLEDLDAPARDQLALLARELSDNPETRKGFLGLARKINPNMPAPELDLDARMDAVVKAADERVAKIEGTLIERDMRAELDRRRQDLIKNGKAANLDDVMAIEKIMIDKKISDHDSGADYWNWMNQAATPTPPSYDRQFMNKTAQDTLKGYWKNPAQAARTNAAAAFDEIRRGRKLA